MQMGLKHTACSLLLAAMLRVGGVGESWRVSIRGSKASFCSYDQERRVDLGDQEEKSDKAEVVFSKAEARVTSEAAVTFR
jgi:hypothetical protein